MSAQPVVSRFAPSPTGELHLGNARTALFSALAAHREAGGRFLLRIEDTDAERSTAAHARGLLEDLRWLGLAWDGEVLQQSSRGGIYDAALAKLLDTGAAYRCFCSPAELERDRAAAAAQGRPPRYSGRCRELSSEDVAAKLASQEPAAIRFRVPESGDVSFDDLVHGSMTFRCQDIGDFVLKRAEGGPSFFFTNALDDAASGINLVLRGEDHLSNTPRQLLLLRALGATPPRYGHLSLLLDAEGKPLSKRRGAASLRQLRESGFLPAAVLNLLFRLGHHSGLGALLDLPAMATAFSTSELQKASAHFDETQLHAWQKRAAHALTADERERWLAGVLPASLDDERRAKFVAAVAPNLVLPSDAVPWVEIVFGDPPEPTPDAAAALASAPSALFAAALAAYAPDAAFKALSAAAGAATGLKGPALFKPLRAALTARLDGPELAALLPLIPPSQVRSRLARFA
ncbi:MAG: glutamate--tRNA ligase [Steroidobacteraceae bacterium]